MSYSIIWSPTAKNDYAELLKYIDTEYSRDAALKVLDKTDKVLARIEKFPKVYKKSSYRKDIRKAVITKHTSLLYRIHSNSVELLSFWDNRRNPDIIADL